MTVLNAKKVGLAKLLKDIFRTTLVPDINNEKLSGHGIAVVIGGFLIAVSFLLFLVRSFLAYKVTFKIMIFLCKLWLCMN